MFVCLVERFLNSFFGKDFFFRQVGDSFRIRNMVPTELPTVIYKLYNNVKCIFISQCGVFPGM